MRVGVREIGWVVGALLVAGLPTGSVRGQEEEGCPNPPRHEFSELELRDVCPNPPLHEFSEDELRAKLKAHEEWVNRGSKGSGRAILCDANLCDANLRGAVLSGADLRKANLVLADLIGANLGVADLSGADLRFADLSRGKLVQTNVKEAILSGVTLTDAQYEPSTAPAKGSVSGQVGLTTGRFRYGEESGLVLLREVLRESGVRNLERQATFAFEHGRTRYALAGHGERTEYDDSGLIVKKDVGAQIEGVLKLVFFEWTTDYGLHYGKPIITLLLIVFAIGPAFYFWPIWIAHGPGYKHGIYRTWPKGRLETEHGWDRLAARESIDRVTRPLLRAILFAVYFSILSSFWIGWRDLNVGSWLTRLQFREYDLRGRGWVRFVSGLQSLVSVYLLAIWSLTYFGRPFQ